MHERQRISRHRIISKELAGDAKQQWEDRLSAFQDTRERLQDDLAHLARAAGLQPTLERMPITRVRDCFVRGGRPPRRRRTSGQGKAPPIATDPKYANRKTSALTTAVKPLANYYDITVKGTPMMNDNRLSIYVNDHLALLVAETELAQRCHGSNRDGALGHFLQQLADDLLAEQDVLKEILRSVGGSESLIKQGMAWLAEKAGRFKLNDALLEYSDLSRLVELESLGAAAVYRTSFWENLQATRGADMRLSHVDFAQHHERAQRHCDMLGKHRLAAATPAL